jgi:hypothetical protein
LKLEYVFCFNLIGKVAVLDGHAPGDALQRIINPVCFFQGNFDNILLEGVPGNDFHVVLQAIGAGGNRKIFDKGPDGKQDFPVAGIDSRQPVDPVSKKIINVSEIL